MTDYIIIDSMSKYKYLNSLIVCALLSGFKKYFGKLQTKKKHKHDTQSRNEGIPNNII